VGGGDLEPLPIATEDAANPTAAAQGNRLAFIRRHRDTNIWKISAFENRQPVKLTSATREDAEPAFSADGRRIAFASDRSGSFQIYVCASDGSNPLQLTSMKAPDTGTPKWSPDGKRIAFDSRVEGHSDIFVISADGGSPRRLTSEPYDNELPSWSHDGRWIYFSSDRSGSMETWKVPPEGGIAVRVSRTGALNPLESSDGQFLYYYRNGTIWQSDLNGENESRVVDVPGWSNFRLVRNAIWFLDDSITPARLGVFDLSRRQATSLRPLNVGPYVPANRGFDVSADGRAVLYTRMDSVESDIMLVENFH